MRCLSIAAVGVNITTSGTSASSALPTNAAGSGPHFVRVAATAAAYVKLGASGVAATTNDILVQPGDAVVLMSRGFSHIAAIQAASAGAVSVTPVEDVR